MADRREHQSPPQRRFTDERPGFTGAIGRDTLVEGLIRGTTELEIWGSFDGQIEVEGLVWLRPGSRVKGDIAVTDLVVEGELDGKVRATGKVDLRATCRVEAEITASRVAAAEGSQIEGRITVTGKAEEVVGYSERRER
ncbi:MAG: polymer-forming cytoskeletal protein [Thermoanaerobaculales bacterium]|jgi:cytoskeletal protein CcmA (bactofilin family)|nr:polymer-forming cytoskeletal protein [Thermoanaerobaculales bacterium]